MPNAQDPFEMDDGFENIPVVQAPAQSVNKVANTTVKHTAQQAKAIAKTFVSQLYGASTTQAPADDDQQGDAAVDPLAMAQKMQATGHGMTQTPTSAHHAAVQQHAMKTTSNTTTAGTPEEEEQLARARRELAQTHHSDYYVPTFGDITSLETDVRKEAQKTQQEEEQRKQEEEQEKQKLEQLEEQKKQEPPMSVQQARTKSERRPGAG